MITYSIQEFQEVYPDIAHLSEQITHARNILSQNYKSKGINLAQIERTDTYLIVTYSVKRDDKRLTFYQAHIDSEKGGIIYLGLADHLLQ